ncbi:MAG: alpha/beta hydrolase, partial [Actinomycetota bacterium]|nr:alpha/beta hydrolase [Actinomycetota bacterium]
MDALEREYSPSSRVGGSAEPFVADYVLRSEAARSALGDDIVTFAGSSLLVAPDPSAPLLVFIHGGYWQALSAEASLYLAPGALANGWSFAAVEYPLAPAASLSQIVAECAVAIGALASLVSPARVVLAGHSAGAHLAAMTSIAARPPLPIDRTVLVSG